MIYFFHSQEKNDKALKLVRDLQTKKPDLSFVSLDAESFLKEDIGSLTGAQGLFERKLLLYLKNIFVLKDAEEKFFDNLEAIQESSSFFVVEASALKKSEVEKIKKHSEKSVIDLKEKKEIKEWGNFAITDAFGKKDRRAFWKKLIEAKEKGIEAEEIHGIIFWQAKSILLSIIAKSATEAGLKPFVYSKAESFSKSWTKEEIENMVSKLVSIYHEAHRGNCDIYDELEKIALTI